MFGFALLGITVLSASSLGASLNQVTAKTVLLKSAWRYQALLLLLVIISPVYCLYDYFVLRKERLKEYAELEKKQKANVKVRVK